MKNMTPKKLQDTFVPVIGLLIVLCLLSGTQKKVLGGVENEGGHPALSKAHIMDTNNCGNVGVVLTPSSGEYNDEIKVYINISNNQCEICFFGFDLSYDTSMFSYQGIEVQNCLTSDWNTVDGNEITPGQIRVGGFAGSSSCIQSTDNGYLVAIKLKIICQCGVCSDGQQSHITIDSYLDDLSSYLPQPAQGTFTLICCCGDISIPTDEAGTWGDEIHIPVNIANNDNQICDFRFDYVFDPAVFEFKDIEKSSSTQDWTTVEWNQIEAGKVRITGQVGSGSCIPASSSAALVTMKMMVKCVGYGSDTPTPIKIEAFSDGISCLCPRSFSTTFLYRTCPRLGDVNGDGNITPADAQGAFDIYLGRVTPTINQLTTSDGNCSCPCSGNEHTAQNTCATPADAQWIFEHYIGRRTLPLCCADFQCAGSSGMPPGEAAKSSPGKRLVYALPTIGNSEENVMVPVMVNNPAGIRHFSMEMVYPQDLLEYTGLLRSPLTQGFEHMRGEEKQPGIINIEGRGKEEITAGETGSLCVASFRVREKMYGRAPIDLYNLDGDIFGADSKSSIFIRREFLMNEERSLSLGESQERGGKLIVPIQVTEAFGLKAFGLDVKFSTDKMTFVGVSKTNLTKDFVALDGVQIKKGIVRIGGFGMHGIQERDGGMLVKLVFQKNGPGGDVEIIRVIDDLRTFKII